ncbi:MAG TPA: hypothetical protein VGL81_22505 [Polyangiaceae bacterium]|nr:hypothetical protein [Polyangiaceae bacterium]
MNDHRNVFHPSVIHVITGVLANHGYRNGDLQDAIVDVQVRAVEGLERRKTPATIRSWEAYCAKIAVDYAIDECRKGQVRDKYDAGLCDTPDDFAPFAPSGEARDPVDAKRQLAVLLEMFDKGEMPEKGKEILLGVADRVKPSILGQELGLPVKEVRSRLQKMRRLFFKRLAVLGLMVMMMALTAVLGGGVAGIATREGEGTGAAPATSVARMPPRARVETQRACDADHRDECDAPDASNGSELELEAKPR